MKIKFLALAMIAMLFTACKPTPDGGDESNPNNGEVENSYIAISIASTGTDRDEVFDDGTPAERAVKSVYIFFFKDGNPFIGASGTGNNYQLINFTSGNQDPVNDNVSDVTDRVLVIRNYKGELPNQMVAVLNWTPTETTYTLDALREHVVGYANTMEGTEYFIMSNSAHKNAAGGIYATPLEITNFKESADAAMANPVKVYVERVAAKVRLNTPNVIDHKYALLKKGGGNMTIGSEQIYAKIIGWDLYNDYTESYLIKKLPNLAYNDEFEGFYWNSPSNHRSYWAESYAQTINDQFNWNTMTYPTSMYCCENTTGNEETAANLRTKVVLKAELQDASGDPVEIARWFSNDYLGRANLIQAVSNTLVNTYYYGVVTTNGSTTDTTFNSITAADLMAVAGDGTNAEVYQVYFQLSTEAEFGTAKTWYKRTGDKFTAIDNAALNAEFIANITPALLYSDGQTYYYTDIKHLGTSIGVVRNHVYDVNITSITGYGTPVVYDKYTITTPVVPEDDKETFVAAEINILSWRVVTNNVDL